MFFCVLIGMLSAFGLICAIWTLCGFFLRPDEGMLYYTGSDPVEFARRYLWLREMGLIRCSLGVSEPPEMWRSWLEAQGIEVLTGIEPGLDRREKV